MSERQVSGPCRRNSRRSHRLIAVANENEMPPHAASATQKKENSLGCFQNQSVIRAFTILKSFYSLDEWVAACELSRRAKIHEATVNRFLKSLTDVGAVVRAEDGRYRCVLFVMSGMQGRPFTNDRELA